MIAADLRELAFKPRDRPEVLAQKLEALRRAALTTSILAPTTGVALVQVTNHGRDRGTLTPETIPPASVGEFTTAPTENDVFEVCDGADLVTIAWVPISTDLRYRGEWRARLTKEPIAGTAKLFTSLTVYDAQGRYLGDVAELEQEAEWTLADSWKVYRSDVAGVDVRVAHPTSAYLRAALRRQGDACAITQISRAAIGSYILGAQGEGGAAEEWAEVAQGFAQAADTSRNAAQQAAANAEAARLLAEQAIAAVEEAEAATIAAALAAASSASVGAAHAATATAKADIATGAASSATAQANVAQGHAINSGNSALASQSSAESAAISVTAAAASASAAQTARLAAESARNIADQKASAAFTSETTAATHASSAGVFAAAAQVSRLAAEAAQATSTAQATIATTAATTATNQASIATTSANLSARYQQLAATARRADFTQGFAGWAQFSTSDWAGLVSIAGLLPSGALLAPGSFDGGNWFTSPPGAPVDIVFLNKIAIDPTRKYRFKAKWGAYYTGSSGQKASFYIGFAEINAAGNVQPRAGEGTYGYSVAGGGFLFDGQTAELESAIYSGIGALGDGGTFRAGTVAIVPMALLNYPNPGIGANIRAYLKYIEVHDVTESLLATTQASIASAAAATATSSASTAQTSRDLAASYRDQAQGHAGTAGTQAGIASSAAATATAASASATEQTMLSASVNTGSINPNPNFIAWPAGQPLPTAWNVWADAGVARLTTPDSFHPIVEMTSGAAQNVGLLQNYTTPGLSRITDGWYVLELDAQPWSGPSWVGTGMGLWCFGNAGEFLGPVTISCAADRLPDGSFAPWNFRFISKWRKLVPVPPGTRKAILYVFQNYPGYFGDPNGAKVIRFFRAAVRAATPSEIRDQTVLPGLISSSATHTTQIAALAATDSAAAQTVTNLTARVGNTEASVSQQAGAIVGLNNRTSAYVKTIAVAGNNRAQLTLYADANGGAGVDIVGDVGINGSLVVTGTITTPKIADQAVTQSVAINGGFTSVSNGQTDVAATLTATASGAGIIRLDVQFGSRINPQGTSGTARAFVRRTQGGAVVSVGPSYINLDLNTSTLPQSFWFLDGPAAGAVQYELVVSTDSGNRIFVVTGVQMVFTEFKK